MSLHILHSTRIFWHAPHQQYKPKQNKLNPHSLVTSPPVKHRTQTKFFSFFFCFYWRVAIFKAPESTGLRRSTHAHTQIYTHTHTNLHTHTHLYTRTHTHATKKRRKKVSTKKCRVCARFFSKKRARTHAKLAATC
jgi:hypothetical protein